VLGQRSCRTYAAVAKVADDPRRPVL